MMTTMTICPDIISTVQEGAPAPGPCRHANEAYALLDLLLSTFTPLQALCGASECCCVYQFGNGSSVPECQIVYQPIYNTKEMKQNKTTVDRIANNIAHIFLRDRALVVYL
ncbi:hypothetical protein BDV27DRAFT_131944 [Aspergillus caelatus]|uniref:Uncharacterized protein n=1 Tax=Aspergillus caelatus TaxID=61420 RepID=A0A5N7A0Z8_9EURO|nr:uncharacterized protein BDV27DRAFT_131944 [Aspergillus caelatus]KAE8362180.1 hypothetical protein BDV27DRAFT_131944 [Aspergillus caelatus]